MDASKKRVSLVFTYIFLLIGLLFHTIVNAAPTVSNVLPKTATLYQTQTFSVYGQNLNSLFNPWIKNCRNLVKLAPRSADDPKRVRRFRCTPFQMGNMDAKIRYTTQNPPSTIPLYLFNVNVIGPEVTSITPSTLTYGQLSTISVKGSRLTPSTKLFIEHCWQTKRVSGGSWTERKFTCWPRYRPGVKRGYVKVGWNGRTVLAKQFFTTVKGPTITSVTSNTPLVLGQKAYIRVRGSNLSPRLGLTMQSCSNMQHLGGDKVAGTSTLRIFTCTPRYTGGSKKVVVYTDRNFPKGKVWEGTLFVNTPTITSITSDVIIGGQASAYRGQPVNITVTGRFLSSNIVLRYSTNSQPLNFVACYGMKGAGGNSVVRRFTCNASWSSNYNWIRFGIYDNGQRKFLPFQGRATKVNDPRIRLYFSDVTSVTPRSVDYNKFVTFTVRGNGFWSRTNMRLPGCTGIRKLTGGTTTLQRFSCRVIRMGTLSGTILDGFRVMRRFSVNVIKPTPPPPPPPVNPPDPFQCSPVTRRGVGTGANFLFDMGQSSGTFRIDYDTQFVKDEIIVTDENDTRTLFRSGCVGTQGFVSRNISFSTRKVHIYAVPNCDGSTNTTVWDVRANCP